MTKTIETEILIDAPASVVWDVLMRTEAWADWNPSFCYVDAPFRKGNAFEVHLRMNEGDPVVAHPVVVELDAQKKVLMWKGVLGGAEWIFCGYHRIEVHEHGAQTRVVHEEDMKGIAMPLVHLTGQVKATTRGFEAMNDALKARCEAIARDPA